MTERRRTPEELLRLVQADELAQAREDGADAPGELFPRNRADAAAAHVDEASTGLVDHPEAGDPQSGVDAQDAQGAGAPAHALSTPAARPAARASTQASMAAVV